MSQWHIRNQGQSRLTHQRATCRAGCRQNDDFLQSHYVSPTRVRPARVKCHSPNMTFPRVQRRSANRMKGNAIRCIRSFISCPRDGVPEERYQAGTFEIGPSYVRKNGTKKKMPTTPNTQIDVIASFVSVLALR